MQRKSALKQVAHQAALETQMIRLAQLEQTVEKTQIEISQIHQDITSIKSMFDQLRGGWRGLVTIIGGASLLGALIANLMSVLKKLV